MYLAYGNLYLLALLYSANWNADSVFCPLVRIKEIVRKLENSAELTAQDVSILN